MNKLKFFLLALCLCLSTQYTALQAETPQKPYKIAVVNFKACVEKAKLGKQEQANFEALKKKMEATLEGREKQLNELANKLNDNDYLDSLSPEAETDLKRTFRQLNQEIGMQQNQFYQTLNQTNIKVIQKLTELVTKASNEIAKNEGYDFIFSEEGSFYFSPALDISDQVIAILDRDFENEPKDNALAPSLP